MSEPYDLALMPKQVEFATDDTAWEILYSGAFGAGKTRALCVRALLRAQHKGARVGLTRKRLSDLKASTLITLLEPDGELPAILQAGSYDYNKGDMRIHLHGGGEIVCFGCDDPEKVGSRPLTDVCIDEAIELDKEEYDMLLGRRRGKYIRPDGTENTRTIAMATNPGAPSHFLYARFYTEPHPHRRLIETNTAENYFLAEDYVESLSELTGAARDRYFQGLWVAYEGAIYPMFDPSVHVRKRDEHWDYFVAGVDCGLVNPNVIRVHGCKRGLKVSHVVAEYYESGITSPVLVQKAKRMSRSHGPITFVIDPSAPDVITQFRMAGLNVKEHKERDVLAGIRKVQAALSFDDRRPPALTMDPDCHKGNAEYPAYRWNDRVDIEKPIKDLDHALDADRYARTYIDRGLGEPVALIGAAGRTPPTPPAKPDTTDHGGVKFVPDGYTPGGRGGWSSNLR